MKKIIVFFSLLIVPLFVTAQIVNIPDAKFKAELVGNSEINTNGDYEIQVSEALAFTGFIGNLNSRGIKDMTGIEAFTQITGLNCMYNFITILDVSKNTALTQLYCHNNSLSSLDVTNNTALVTFFCSNNPLNTLDVTQNTALSTLFCSANLLTNLDVTKNTALTNLYCYSNSLTSLDVTQNTLLTLLNCNWNSLTSLDVANNVELMELYCNSNSLTSLDLNQNIALTSLRCYNNSLTSLDVTQNTALTTLYCYDNLLTSLDIRNGNNMNLIDYYPLSYDPYPGIDVTGNPNLFCISVDDTAYSNTNWSPYKDSWAVYSNDCTVGIADSEPSQPAITTQNNAIIITGKGTTSIYNLQGQRVHQSKLTGKTSISLDKGIYLVRVIDGKRGIIKKVYLN